MTPAAKARQCSISSPGFAVEPTGLAVERSETFRAQARGLQATPLFAEQVLFQLRYGPVAVFRRE